MFKVYKDRFNKKYVFVLIFSILMCSTFTTVFSIGVLDNPDFTLQEFCMSLASEFVGLIITVVIFDTYIKLRKEYREQYIASQIKKTPETAAGNNRFKTLISESVSSSEKITTFVDNKTGVQYLLITNEHGSGLTPLLDKNGKPVKKGN